LFQEGYHFITGAAIDGVISFYPARFLKKTLFFLLYLVDVNMRQAIDNKCT